MTTKVKKNEITVDMRQEGVFLDPSDLCGDIKGIIKRLEDVLCLCKAKGFDSDDVIMDVSVTTHHYSDDSIVDVCVYGLREETDEEYTIRKKKEKELRDRNDQIDQLVKKGMTPVQAVQYIEFQKLKAQFEHLED